MFRTLLVGSVAGALLAACGPTETRTVYYNAPPATYTSGYYVTPVVTVREPRYYNYYSPGYYDSYGVWRTERTTY